ncbi:DUF3570 domain-containing protein [Algibacter sp. 2305UL17-15]|uniref:DUF3570 domain-containing protein n=1 Tax=Algibacter sp. 2305UL17-15 TaxID=3231268 RepID=UPI00345A7F75
MNKKLLMVGSLAFIQLMARAQAKENAVKERVSKTEIEMVYNHYLQDGDNSAVTGGVGTERLTVYGPSFTLKRTWQKHALSFNIGADVISSASTDNIDAIMSSASRLDTRTYGFTTYERTLEKSKMSIYGGIGFSIESDYFSFGSKIGLVKEDTERLATYSAQFQMFIDDLRWGRLDDDHNGPEKLIYPSELRFKEWYDVSKRNSFNLKLGYSKIINKKTILGVYPELTYQEGLLETPFHRVYFSDGMLGVEQLPNERWKGALALKLNSFVLGNLILKNGLQGYADNFGILGFSMENETVIKLKPELQLLPNFRFYTQKASKYFDEFMQHDSADAFFTSDFDLSNFQTYNAGLGLKVIPHNNIKRKSILNTMVFRYNFMYRSNGLRAHIISISFQTEKNKG